MFNRKVLSKNKRQIEKEVFDVTAPFLNLPPTTINGTNNPDGKRKYIAARRAIQDAVKDPLFVQRFQEQKLSMRELLTQSFPPAVFRKLFETDINYLVPEKKKSH